MREFVRRVVSEMSREDVRTSKDLLVWLGEASEDPESWGGSDKTGAMLRAIEEYVETTGKPVRYLGAGSSRKVFALDDRRVVKIALGGKGIEQNTLEATAGSDPQVDRLLAKVRDYAADFSWVVSDRVEPLSSSDSQRAEEIVGVEWQEVREALGLGRSQSYDVTRPDPGMGRKKSEITVRGKGCLSGEEFLEYLREFLGRYKGMLPGDLGKVSSWGVSPDGCLVLLDYGITTKAFRKLYK